MSKKNLRRLSFVAIATLCAGIVAAIGAFALRSDSPRGFTIFYTSTRTPLNDVPKVEGARVRYNKADGSFVETTTYLGPNGDVTKKHTLLGLAGRGVFSLSEKNSTQEFMSDLANAPLKLSEVDFRRDPNFNREETLLGYKVFVMRHQHDEEGYTEVWRAPALQGMPLKTAFMMGSKGTTVIEATRVELGEPPISAFAVPNYPVSFEHFEKKVQNVEETNPALANAMRQQLEQKRLQQ